LRAKIRCQLSRLPALDVLVVSNNVFGYGVATTSRLLQIVGLFCKRALLKGLYCAKETYILRSLLIVATPYRHLEPGGSFCFDKLLFLYVYIHIYEHMYIKI